MTTIQLATNQITQSRNIHRSLEREVAFAIKAKIEKTLKFPVKLVPSPISQSRYLFIKHPLKDKGVCVKVSDHFKDTSLNMSRSYLKTTDVKSFYIFTAPVFIERSKYAMYELQDVDKLVEDVVKYLQE